MNEVEALEFLTIVLTRLFGREVIATADLRAKDVFGWDSFRQIELILDVQLELNIELTPEEMDGIDRLGTLAHYIQRHTSAQGSYHTGFGC